MSNRDILAIGASAGGVEALVYLATRFKAEFPASVLITLHIGRQTGSTLDELLSRSGSLPAKFAQHGEPLRKGHIYIAPADRHLLIEGDRIYLGVGPRENNSRPAIDPMLRSAALCCCARTVAVVLTGTLGDGASGLWTVNQCGGMTVVQDPRDAAFPEMPRTAIELAQPDHVVALEQMPALLHSLVHQPAGEPGPVPPGTQFEVDVAKRGAGTLDQMDRIGKRSVLSCPQCQGVMWEIAEGNLPRFRCHVGHTFAPDLLNLALDDNLPRALGSAQRALEERTALARKLYHQALHGRHRLLAENWLARAREFEQETQIIKDSIRRMEQLANGGPTPEIPAEQAPQSSR